MFNKKMIKIASRAQYQLIFFQRPYAQQGPDPLPRGLLLRFTKQSEPVREACASAPKVHEACGAGRRPSSQWFTRYDDAQSCSSPRARARSAHITSLLFFG